MKSWIGAPALYLLGVVLFVTGSLLTGAAAGLIEADPAPAGNVWQRPQAWDDEAGWEAQRHREVSIVERNGSAAITWRLTSGRSDPVVRDVAAGRATDLGIIVATEIMALDIERRSPGSSALRPVWRPSIPTTTNLDDTTAVVELTATVDVSDSLTTFVLLLGAAPVEIDVVTDTTTVAGVGTRSGEPTLRVESREPRGTTFVVEGSGTDVPPVAEVVLAADGVDASSFRDSFLPVPSDTGDLLRSGWPVLLLLLPPLVVLRRSSDAERIRTSAAYTALRTTVLALATIVVFVVWEAARGPLLDRVLPRRPLQLDFLERPTDTDWTLERLPTAIQATADLPTVVVLLGLGLAPLLLARPPVAPSPRRARSSTLLVMVLVASALAASTAALFESRLAAADESGLPVVPWVVHLLAGTGVALVVAGTSALTALAGGRRTSRLLRFLCAAATAVAVLLLQLAAIHRSALQEVAGWASVVLAALLLTGLVAGSWDTLSDGRAPWRARCVLFVASMAVTAPRFGLGRGYDFPTVTDAWFAVDASRGALHLALILTVVAVLRTMRSDPGTRPGPTADRPETLPRALFIAVGLILVLRPNELLWSLPLSAVVGASALHVVDRPRRPSAPPYRARVRALAALSSRRRLLAELEKTTRKAVAAGEIGWSEAERKLATFRAESMSGSTVAGYAAARAAVFAVDPGGAWRRGTTGLLVASVAGLPGLLQALGPLSGLSANSPTPLLQAATTLALALRYPLYGLFFGFFLGRFPGATAVGRSVSFFAVLASSELVAFLPAALEGRDGVVASSVSWVVQLFLICFALGLWFDLRVLRSAGLGLAALGDVHHANRVLAWSSVLAVSVGTALTAALTSSAITLLVGATGG